ncbi:major facilitator superfamily domain-containing protein [Scleroderma citrinum]
MDVKRNVQSLLSVPRIATLLGSILVALCSGTNYVAYAPQLGARLHISHTRLNVLALAGHAGFYLSGPIWGRIIDARGPRIPLIGASVFFFVAYAGTKRIYDDGIGTAASISPVLFVMLVMLALFIGFGANAGLNSSINTVAKSFPESAHATTIGSVQAGLGLSAFCFSTIAHVFFPGDTSSLLHLLSLATSLPILFALFIVRPIPLPQSHPNPKVDQCQDDEPVQGGECAPCIAGPGVDTTNTGEPDCCTPLLVGNACVPESSSALEIGQAHDIQAERPDIHGVQLFTTPEFYLIVSIMTLLSGTGLMYANNVGLISLALYAKSNPYYDQIEAAKWQATQVSTFSIGSCAGRLLTGLLSDFTRNYLRLPRALCLCIVSSVFVISQAFAIGVSDVSALWIPSVLVGFAYGGMFGALPPIVIEWFGLAHLSENWGWVALSPLGGGNIFSIMFGRNLDAHTPSQDLQAGIPGVGRAVAVLSRMVLQDATSEQQCLGGRECYVSSLWVTLVACVVALALSTWATIRDRWRSRVRI